MAVVEVNAAGHPDYAFYREGVADRAISAKRLVEACEAANQPAVVCTGTLALSPDDADIYLPWLQAQRQSGKTVVVDANFRPSVMADLVAYRSHVLAALQLADVIKVSDEDLDVLATPGQDAVHKAQYLLRTTTARVVALTQGSAGAALITRGGVVFHARESLPLTVVDTVGDSDCFLARLLVAMLDDARPPSAWLDAMDDAAARRLLTHAVASASLCVLRRGCVPRPEKKSMPGCQLCHVNSAWRAKPYGSGPAADFLKSSLRCRASAHWPVALGIRH